jgi:2-succinyl-5-enolpyruvyl-6-hydroxy-3-cyclohexene-1-carboxylate synthase
VALQKSVPTTSVVPATNSVQSTFAATLVDEWARHGLTDVVICPGSRSTPLALAMARRSEIRLHVRIDERSAAFFAIGRALVTRRPVAIVVTSGTAAAELHAAVAEADLANVALLVLTADRPPELHGVGAPQTIDQQHLYGSMVRLYEEPGVARSEASASWRPLAQRLWRAASGVSSVPGPVHLNAAFVEPLLGEPAELPVALDDRVDDQETRAPLFAQGLGLAGQRVLAVVGSGTPVQVIDDARSLNWVVLGDATARGSLAYADPLLRHEDICAILEPDVVVRLGGIPASKFLAQRLVEWGRPVIALQGAGPVADPDAVVTRRVQGLPNRDDAAQFGDANYFTLWHQISAGLDKHLSTLWGEQLDEVRVARVVVDAANDHEVPLVVGSSMPVRDVEWWSSSRSTQVYSNRGANGIDGVVSTVLGVASGSRAIGLVGDVTMLHDVSALVDTVGNDTSCVLVVSDNRGGGIFSFLAQARDVETEKFELLYGTARPHDLTAVASAFGHFAMRVTTASALRHAIDERLAQPGLSVVVAELPSRDDNVRRHEELNSAVGNWWTLQ